MKLKNLVLGILLCGFIGQGAVAIAAESSYGPVQADESLFRIALKHRPKSITASQMMISIFEANPEAFEKGNINRLKAGSVLKIPDLETIQRLAPKQAFSEASSQIEVYEKEVRALRVQRGEMAPLALKPRDPDLAPGANLLSGVSDADLADIKKELKKEETRIAQGALPEPKARPRKKRRQQAAPPIRYSYDVAIVDDDNVRLAQNDEDIRSDLILSGTVKARGGKSLDSFSIWNYGASATYNLHDTFGELDNTEIEINTRYRFALASGFSAPIYALSAKLGGLEYDSEMRDSTVLSLSAELNKWLTNTINMTAGIGLKQRESVSEVYDLSETRLFVNLDTNLSKTDLIYTTLTYITGDTVSSATPSLDIINAADAIEPDDAFGGIDANQFAYRIEADTVVLTVGYNRIFTPDISFDLSARLVRSEAEADDSIYYERTILRASLLGRF